MQDRSMNQIKDEIILMNIFKTDFREYLHAVSESDNTDIKQIQKITLQLAKAINKNKKMSKESIKLSVIKVLLVLLRHDTVFNSKTKEIEIIL